jgi:hypothetical protein
MDLDDLYAFDIQHAAWSRMSMVWPRSRGGVNGVSKLPLKNTYVVTGNNDI